MDKTFIMDKNSGRFYEKGRKNPYTHCVVYRRGNKENFSWLRTFSMTEEEARQQATSMNEKSYNLAYSVNYKMSLSIGLPETYDENTQTK